MGKGELGTTSEPPPPPKSSSLKLEPRCWGPQVGGRVTACPEAGTAVTLSLGLLSERLAVWLPPGGSVLKDIPYTCHQLLCHTQNTHSRGLCLSFLLCPDVAVQGESSGWLWLCEFLLRTLYPAVGMLPGMWHMLQQLFGGMNCADENVFPVTHSLYSS